MKANTKTIIGLDIDSLITKLQAIKAEHGNIKVGISQADDYWGSIESELHDFDINVKTDSCLDGPKKPSTGLALIIEAH